MSDSRSISELVDSSLFLAMHSRDEDLRLAAKGYFVSRFERTVGMSLEHVGKCDDVIWQCSRELQDVYYPFMDRLHSDMRVERIAYAEADLKRSLEDPLLKGLPLYDRSLVAVTLNRGAVLYSGHPPLWSRPDLPVRRPAGAAAESVDEGVRFPPYLEELYRESLRLRLDVSAYHADGITPVK